MAKILPVEFFNRPTHMVAQELLGKFLVRNIAGHHIAVMITETEAYDGFDDLASHASKGKTNRTQTMFGHPAHFYVYLCYGVHYMLNVVTREYDYPAAVLIRGVVFEDTVLDGPGKLTKFLHIDKNFNNQLAKKSTGLWFEDRGFSPIKTAITLLPRVGVAYAGPVWGTKKLRFLLQL